MKLVSLYQRLLISEKEKRRRNSVEKCLVIKALFILMGSKTPPQNLAKAKKLGGDQLPIKSDCSTNNQCGMKKTPLIKVSLYLFVIL